MEVNKKKGGIRLPKSIRPDEFKLLVNIIPKDDINLRIAVLLGYGVGMRISEVLRCNPSHFRENSIFIPESKYGVERVVPIPKGWKDEFKKDLPIKIGKRAVQKAFKKYCKMAKLNPKYTFHSLRHGFATRLLENGAPINQVQILMGHSNISTTNVYTRANPLDAIKSYEDLF